MTRAADDVGDKNVERTLANGDTVITGADNAVVDSYLLRATCVDSISVWAEIRCHQVHPTDGHIFTHT